MDSIHFSSLVLVLSMVVCVIVGGCDDKGTSSVGGGAGNIQMMVPRTGDITAIEVALVKEQGPSISINSDDWKTVVESLRSAYPLFVPSDRPSPSLPSPTFLLTITASDTVTEYYIDSNWEYVAQRSVNRQFVIPEYNRQSLREVFDDLQSLGASKPAS